MQYGLQQMPDLERSLQEASNRVWVGCAEHLTDFVWFGQYSKENHAPLCGI